MSGAALKLSSFEEWCLDPVAFEMRSLRIALRERHAYQPRTYGRIIYCSAARRAIERIRAFRKGGHKALAKVRW